MTRSQKRKLAIAILLALILAALAVYYFYYRSTKKLALDIAPTIADVVPMPQFLYAFSGTQKGRLQHPLGVLVDGGRVYVADSRTGLVHSFNELGEDQRTFNTSETVTPLYIAKNPKDGMLYISDRRKRAVLKFTTAGEYKGEFDPKLPKKERPKFETGGVQWAPVALAFDTDGTMFVTEILKGHRLLIFGPDGKFKKSVGDLGIVNDAAEGPEFFQFPNGLAVNDGLVYVADSNNRRIKIYDKNGAFKQIVVTAGLPRGLSFLQRLPGDSGKAPARYVVVDTLAHDGTIWSAKGEQLVSFGEQGILEGQFSYPNAVGVSPKNKMFISDSGNGRIQVWGWPAQASVVPIPRVPATWWPCLLVPALLALLWLLTRKRKFFATVDFFEAMVDTDTLDLLPDRRRAWFVTMADYERLSGIEQGDVRLADLLRGMEYSESDMQALREKLEVDEETAIIVSIARRTKVFCTEDEELRRIARVLDIDVVNREEFIRRFASKRGSQAPTE